MEGVVHVCNRTPRIRCSFLCLWIPTGDTALFHGERKTMPRHDAELNLPREAADFLPAPFLGQGNGPGFFAWVGLLVCGGLIILMISCAVAIFHQPEVRYVQVPVQQPPQVQQTIT